jgi:hypothetical protein
MFMRLLLGICMLAPFTLGAAELSTSAASTPSVIEEVPVPESNVVVLQGLNKVTGHISTFDAPLNSRVSFGKLEVMALRCWKSPPEERPENAALLEIRDQNNGEEVSALFTGWMFSSSPGLSGLENPVYDISVVACTYKAPFAATTNAAASAPKTAK